MVPSLFDTLSHFLIMFSTGHRMSADNREPAGSLQVALGGKHGFSNVRGGQGRDGLQFQGYTPASSRSTSAMAYILSTRRRWRHYAGQAGSDARG